MSLTNAWASFSLPSSLSICSPLSVVTSLGVGHIIWSGSRRVRERMKSHEVKRIYYTILAAYVVWTFLCATMFLFFSKPKVMILVIAMTVIQFRYIENKVEYS